jgi:hypothetical protein
MGSTPSVTNGDSESCGYTFPNVQTIAITLNSDSDLASTKTILGSTARDITVGSLPGVTGAIPFLNQPVVYVQRGTDQLQVLGVLFPVDEATTAKLVQVATLAASRW